MSVKLEKINLEKGDSLQITFEGSQEKSVFISVDEDGNGQIEGSINCASKKFIIRINGIREVMRHGNSREIKKFLRRVEKFSA